MTADEIYLAAYDEQIRARITAAEAAGGRADRDGPAVRKAWEGERGLITYRDLDGLDGAALDAFIARQRDHFTRLGHQAEWKYHSHDSPAGLPGRLAAAGFVPEDPETLLIGESARLAAAPDLPPGVTLREVTGRADLERIRDLEQAVWGDNHDWLPAALARDLADPDDPCVVVVAEAGQQVVCAGWIRLHHGTDFASLWGGSTLPRWAPPRHLPRHRRRPRPARRGPRLPVHPGGRLPGQPAGAGQARAAAGSHDDPVHLGPGRLWRRGKGTAGCLTRSPGSKALPLGSCHQATDRL